MLSWYQHDIDGIPHPGDLVNLAEFARLRWWTGGERHDLHMHELEPGSDGLLRPARESVADNWQVGLEWDELRDVRQVVVRYAGPVPPDLSVQYWQKNWPTPAPERRTGARRGWIGRDDPWHGRWVTARGERVIQDNTITFTFDPVDLPELRGLVTAAQLDEAADYLARFRRTLKMRLVCRGDIPPVLAGLGVYSTSTWQEGLVDVHFGPAGSPLGWSGCAWAVNGHILDVELPGPDSMDDVDMDGCWECRTAQEAERVHLHVLYAACLAGSGDCTVLTVETAARSFSFLPADLDRGPIYLPDYGVYITWADQDIPLEEFRAQLAAAPRPIYDRIEDEPEHSLARALAEIPSLDVTKQDSYTGLGRYLPLGVEIGRQEFALRHNGELFADKNQLKLRGRDAARLLWPGPRIRFRFGSGDPPDFREQGIKTEQSLLDGWLPVVISRWLDREIEVEETAFVTLLDGPLTPPEARRGDENVVALLRFVIRNATHGRKRAHLWLAISPQEQLELCGGAVVALGRVVPAEPVARQWRVDGYEDKYLRCFINVGGQGSLAAIPYADEPGAAYAAPSTVVYVVDLDGGASHAITVAVPFVTLTGETEQARTAALDFDDRLADTVAYWRQFVESGGQMDVPERVLADFHKAARVHAGISADKDPVSGLIVVPAATWSYGACGNEACWQIAMLDQAGHHDRAEACLETFLHTQSIARPDGRFASSEGALVAVDLDGGAPVMGTFAYNLDHGFIMECLANHYRYTGNRAWLERVAPNLVAACDWVIRERQSTKMDDNVPEWGLLPAGHLEDNPEWRHWFAVNAHAYAGMHAIAEVLAEIGHPEAERLAGEAADYRQDIRRAARQAMVESPAVRLLDGTYVPHVPTRTGIRGREHGWFREAGYGALHLLEGGVFDPDEEEVAWVLKDLEDNLFVSREWGRPVDLERSFSQGGVTIQPNLMDLGIDYLRRGQIKHALRALYNNFGCSLYPDVRTFTEHPVIELGHGVGPFYKSSDEAKSLLWLRAFLVLEEGTALHLAPGAPRDWFAWCAPSTTGFGVRNMATFFGPLTYRVQPEPSEVTVEVETPARRPPQELIIHLRLPEGQIVRQVTVNGVPRTDFDPIGETVRIVMSGSEPGRASGELCRPGKLLVQVGYEQ